MPQLNVLNSSLLAYVSDLSKTRNQRISRDTNFVISISLIKASFAAETADSV